MSQGTLVRKTTRHNACTTQEEIGVRLVKRKATMIEENQRDSKRQKRLLTRVFTSAYVSGLFAVDLVLVVNISLVYLYELTRHNQLLLLNLLE
jgi:hypothetical protein